MVDSLVRLEAEVRELVRRRAVDPTREDSAFRSLVAEAVTDYEERALRGLVPPLEDVPLAAKAMVDTVAGLGPLQAFLDDPEIEEIWINAPGRVFVARRGLPELTTLMLTSDEVRDLTERMLRPSGRRLDLSTPFVDATLSTGERVHVVIPDVTRAHLAVNIRKYTARAQHLDDLVAIGSLPRRAADFLDAAVAVGLNIIVSGGTQAGKTRLTNNPADRHPTNALISRLDECRRPHRGT